MTTSLLRNCQAKGNRTVNGGCSSVKNTVSRLMQVAHLAGFLKLQGSDLVYNARGDFSEPIYYDCVISSKWNDYGMAAYLAVLDAKTNIREMHEFKIGANKLSGYDLLTVSDITVAALALYVWRTVVAKKKILLLVGDWLDVEQRDHATTAVRPISVDNSVNSYSDSSPSPIDYLKRIAKLYDVSFHIQNVRPAAPPGGESGTIKDGGYSVKETKETAFMLRLLMCTDQPSSTLVTDKTLREFYSLALNVNKLKMCLQCPMFNLIT